MKFWGTSVCYFLYACAPSYVVSAGTWTTARSLGSRSGLFVLSSLSGSGETSSFLCLFNHSATRRHLACSITSRWCDRPISAVVACCWQRRHRRERSRFCLPFTLRHSPLTLRTRALLATASIVARVFSYCTIARYQCRSENQREATGWNHQTDHSTHIK